MVAELLCRAVDIHPGERVLDIAAGSGTAALAAARRGAAVIATDFVPQLLQAAARRAQAEGLPLQTQEADAQRLPFADGAFPESGWSSARRLADLLASHGHLGELCALAGRRADLLARPPVAKASLCH